MDSQTLEAQETRLNKKMKRIAVVILNWNGKSLLEKFLPSLLKYTDITNVDIIVADNCSSDDSITFLSEYYPSLQIIQLSENYGFAEGYNKSLSSIDSEYYILLNSDVEVTEGWINPLIDYLDKNKNVACVQPKVLAERNKEYFEYAGACGGFIDKYGYPFCRGRIFDSVEKDQGQYNSPIQIFWATGACMAIRSSAYKEMGGFDGTFFAHMEEIDLCWRLNARGNQIYCIPESTVYHVGGATLNEESPRKTFLNFRNNMLMLYKNLDEKSFQKIYTVRLFLNYLASLQMVLKGKIENVKAIHQAQKEFKLIRKSYTHEREWNLQKTTVSDIPIIYSKSILWSYYVKGLKKFIELKWQ